MRILHTVECKWVGGAEIGMVSTMATHKAWGEEVHLACRPDSWISRAAETSVDGMLLTKMKGWFGKPSKLATSRMKRYIEEHGIDVVHAHMMWDTIAVAPAARDLGVPIVYTLHGFDKSDEWIHADRIVVISNAIKDYVIARGADENKVVLVYNAVHVPDEIPQRSESRRELGISEDTSVLAVTCRLTPKKGVDVLITAMRDIPEAHLLVAGYGKPKYEAFLRNVAVEAGVANRVTFLGMCDNPHKVMAACDVFVAPSREEAFGRSVMEAMVVGRPVIASNTGGLPEVVADNATGLLVPPEDSGAIADAARRLLASPELRKQMGEAGRERIDAEFRIERMCREFLDVYRDVIAGAKG